MDVLNLKWWYSISIVGITHEARDSESTLYRTIAAPVCEDKSGGHNGRFPVNDIFGVE